MQSDQCLYRLLAMKNSALIEFALWTKRHMSLVMRKPAFCICENKDADQRLCFHYIDSTIPHLSKSEISSLLPSSFAAQPGLCQTWSETPKTGLLTTRLISKNIYIEIS